MNHELLATTAFGLEALVRRELEALGYDARTSEPGRISFHGNEDAIVRSNLWLRTAERVLVVVGRFEASDFDQLFERTQELPWEEWIGPDDEFPVRGRSVKSQLSSVPACQRTVKKAIVQRLQSAHKVEQLAETGPARVIEVALLEDRVTLTIDTTGVGLHKRGYRDLVGAAPLRETLAAALVQLSFWHDDRTLIDPFCGSGTIPIEAALIAAHRAPGLERTFAAEEWPQVPESAWAAARDEARAKIQPIESRIIGYDSDASVLSLARRHAERAGVADAIHFQQRPFEDLECPDPHGVIVTNPPYGERIGERTQVEELYARFPFVLGRLPTWSHFVLTAMQGFEERVGRKADRRRKLYNARLECTYYQFHGPRRGDGSEPTGDEAAATKGDSPSAPTFGDLTAETKRQAELFENRLRKRARHLRRWPTRQGIHCFRLYDRDIPEVPLVVDRYGDRLSIAEYERPHKRTPGEHSLWLEEMVRVACAVTEIDRGHAYLKRRQRMRGKDQYQRLDSDGSGRCVVEEGGLRFRVDLGSYLDTGLFLDHRTTRSKVREEAEGKDFLNLFCYTGAFTVYAAAGGARSTTSVDLSSKYLDWATENLALNDLDDGAHAQVAGDCMEYLRALPPTKQFDLAVVDPPTFSNSKGLDDDWDVQRHHGELLDLLVPRMTPGGVIYFSTNFRKFRFEWEPVGATVREISQQTVPEDFRNRKIHRCWRIVRDA